MVNPTARIWMEISFNLVYLITIWSLVVAMLRRHPWLPPDQHRLRVLFLWAFTLLAVGDTGHVGFRLLALARGNLQMTSTIFGRPVGLVGLGALATAITLTGFYGVMLLIWRERFAKPLAALGWGLIAMGIGRLILLTFPQNQWHCVIPPQPWSFYRNLPLIGLGLGVAYLMLRDAKRTNDRVFHWIGRLVILSFGFYLPVLFWVQTVPALGLLMIPKTLAYLAIAVLAYRSFFPPPVIPATGSWAVSGGE